MYRACIALEVVSIKTFFLKDNHLQVCTHLSYTEGFIVGSRYVTQHNETLL